jgi:acetyl esterase/lipase
MSRDGRRFTRRNYLLSVGAVAGLAGCGSDESNENRADGGRSNGEQQTEAPPTIEPPDPSDPLAERYDLIERETVYRETPEEPLRVVASLPDATGPVPVLMHFHGGAFRGGSPGYLGMDTLARAGIGVISAGYRVSGTARYPAAVRDVIASIQWVQAGEPDWNIATDRVALTGDSAGAHLAALAAAPDHPNFQPVDFPVDATVDVDGVIPHYGIFDFRPEWVCERGSTRVPLEEFLGKPCDEAIELRAEASPAAHVDSDHPPALIFHGEDDTELPVRTARAYRERLAEAGVPVEYREFEGVGHQYFARDTDRREEVFLESHRRMVTVLFEGPWSDI